MPSYLQTSLDGDAIAVDELGNPIAPDPPRLTKEELLEKMLVRVRDDAQRRQAVRLARQKPSITEGDGLVVEDSEVPDTSITKRNSGCIGTYKKGKAEYYRFSYREDGKVRHKHLGPTKDPAIKLKVQRIQIALSQGNSVESILRWYCRK